uniref:Uncharacterized protein n=1 Tax=Lactuca sativa TaxID=4236 RepID=A0A9R1W7T2_LACSA|nr:hypothetical protein LSAT_V11C300131600 [Lactuca sativa]
MKDIKVRITGMGNWWLDVEHAQMLVIDVVEGMKAGLIAFKTQVEKVKEDMEQMKKENVVEGMKVDFVALKIEVEKVKEDMEQMKKENYSDVIAMKEKLYKFTIGFLLLIIMYMMK